MNPDWSFARRPFWIFSHLFAATVIVSFVLLGFWQLSRYHERADRNALIEARSGPPGLVIDEALALPADERDLQAVTATGTFVDGDLARVANRTMDGVAGQQVVALFALDDGRQILVNRGFVPLEEEDAVSPPPAGSVTIDGWLQNSVERGWLQPVDDGTGRLTPRFNVADLARRVDGEVVDVWLREAPGSEPADQFPTAIPMETLDRGPHLSYMAQWWIFATLGLVFYAALLRRTARRGSGAVPVTDDEADSSVPDPHPAPTTDHHGALP
ncbi:MAG: SURF1 family protein [Acidimicrobiales bacterium]